jgi:diguanylate cyclase (GGDEF)-like protein/hemerythrin-like metal-binding protein
MIQAAEATLTALAPLVAGLGTGTAIGWWLGAGRRLRPGGRDCQERLEALARARATSEEANAELREALDQLEQAAGTDRLTGAWNRRRFEDGAAQLMALASRRGDALSFIFFDLDHFKRVNDTFGHEAGDAVLAQVAATVTSQLRASDALARWGGEEFLVLCPATTLSGATILAEKIRQAVAARPVPGVGQVTLSLGVAQQLAEESLEAFLARADGAMYRAKERGRNRTEASLDSGSATETEPRSIFELVWDCALESGNTQIDFQHRQLYGLSNSLLNAITAGHYPEEAKLQMQLLVAHVAQHFHDEEAVLAKAGYPELAAHAAEHARLIAKAKALQQSMGGESTDLPAVLSFLALDLVKGHLVTWDRRFFKHLAEPAPSV